MKPKFEVAVPADQPLSLAPLAYVGLGIVASIIASIVMSSSGVNPALAFIAPITLVIVVVTVLAKRGAAKARRKYAVDLETFLEGIKSATGATLVTNGQRVDFNNLPEYAVLEGPKGFSRWSMDKVDTTVTFKQLEKSVSVPR